jgi:hypothetical protein
MRNLGFISWDWFREAFWVDDELGLEVGFCILERFQFHICVPRHLPFCSFRDWDIYIYIFA